MGLDGSMGFSKETGLKQFHFRAVSRAHLIICRGIATRKDYVAPPYQFWDLTAGAGMVEIKDADMAVPGSPVLFTTTAYELGMPFHARFIEVDPASARLLSERLQDARRAAGEPVCGRYQIINEPYQSAFPRLAIEADRVLAASCKRLGLIYCDTNGTIPPFDMIAQALRLPSFEMMDVLIYLSATNIKRLRRTPQGRMQLDLLTELEMLGKKHLIVRTPAGQHQWTFVLATNWENFPQFKNLGFYSLRNREGRAIITRLNYTASEIATGNLFEVEEEDDGSDPAEH